MDRACNKLFWCIFKVGLAVTLDALILAVAVYIYIYEISEYGMALKVEKMYKNIAAQTGQAQDMLPLEIDYSDVDNASTDGQRITIYMGFIKAHTWDEIAFVIGHEMAHGTLAHLNKEAPIPESGNDVLDMGVNGFNAVLEANADKMGAVYMMKAGYDICKGREIFKHWKGEYGNALAQMHPDFSYRYDELNINCGD